MIASIHTWNDRSEYTVKAHEREIRSYAPGRRRLDDPVGRNETTSGRNWRGGRRGEGRGRAHPCLLSRLGVEPVLLVMAPRLGGRRGRGGGRRGCRAPGAPLCAEWPSALRAATGKRGRGERRRLLPPGRSAEAETSSRNPVNGRWGHHGAGWAGGGVTVLPFRAPRDAGREKPGGWGETTSRTGRAQ